MDMTFLGSIRGMQKLGNSARNIVRGLFRYMNLVAFLTKK